MTSTKRLSLTFRLTLLFAGTSATVLLVLGLIVGTLVQMHFQEMDLELLTGKIELIQHALKKVQTQRDLTALPQQMDVSLFGHPGLVLIILGQNRQALFTTRQVSFPSTLLEPKSESISPQSRSWVSPEGIPFRGISALAPTGIAGQPPIVVAVAMDLTPHDAFMTSFRKALWIVVAIAAVFSGLLGWLVVHRVLAPLRAIRQIAAEITSDQLHQRLAVDAVPSEFEAVVQTLNAMLSRLEASFQRLSDFSSDLAHELRTPITNMRTQTQVILSKPRTAEEYRDILCSNEDEFERLSRMTSDMLFLAKSDHGLLAPDKDVVDLATEVRDLFTFFDALADRKCVGLSIEGEGQIPGDRMLLRRAINNLLSNALRHTSEHGKVHVTISTAQGTGEQLLVIENTGDSISKDDIPRLFDRFYRAEAARVESSEGTGLGLAITKSIVELHGGSIGVQSSNGITSFEIRMPAGNDLDVPRATKHG